MKKHFDPDKSFVELDIVHRTIFILSALSIIVAAIIITNLPNKNFAFTYNGFNNALMIFKTPISILALLIPIIAIYAASHRSAQTKRQMELTNKQIDIALNQVRIATENNAFTNKFKHAEEFDKFMKSRLGDNLRFKILRSLHGKLYPKLNTGDFTLDSTPIKNLESDLEQIVRKAYFDPQSSRILDDIANFESAVDKYCRKYDMKPFDWDRKIVDGSRQKPQSIKLLFSPLIIIAENIVSAASFDGNECLEEFTKTLFSLDLSSINEHKFGFLRPLALANIIDLQ
ncbi:hypothetical protein D3C80_493050 [compost metagenome]